ncbi:MAG: hypothetical protein IT343_04450 [Candidatus Melainabacteria bacterium]|jgi:hypothetical protein|nr:hypothetical protein [Candidatus Melainabacteria bacterium]
MHERTTQVDSFYQIVVSAKIVGPEEAQEAQATAKKLGMSLSQAILILRHATEPTLRFAMDANELVKSDRINVDTAIAAVICARQNEFSIFQALDMMGIVLDKPPPPKVETNALTELMIEASAITMDQLDSAIKKANETGMPLTRSIIFNRYQSRRVVLESISLLKLIREEKVERAEGVRCLKKACEKRQSVWQIMFEQGVYKDCAGASLRLPELLAMSMVVSESDLMDCLEHEVMLEVPLHKLLLDAGLISHSVLEAAMTMLDLVQSYLKPYQAAEALKNVKSKNVGVYQAMAELNPPPQVQTEMMRFGDLLVSAKVADRETIEKIAKEGDKPVKVGKKLLDANIINDQMLYSVLRSQSLYKEGLLSADQTIELLKMCVKTTLTVDEAIAKLGWTIPIRMQWSWT